MKRKLSDSKKDYSDGHTVRKPKDTSGENKVRDLWIKSRGGKQQAAAVAKSLPPLSPSPLSPSPLHTTKPPHPDANNT
jgi:hypothetical protein